MDSISGGVMQLQFRTPGQNNSFLLCTMIFFLTLLLPAFAGQNRAILIVSNRNCAKMTKIEKELVKNLQTHRAEYGFNDSNLPILVYDYSKPEIKSYVKTLGIDSKEIPCLAIVTVNIRTRGDVKEEIPAKVLKKFAQSSEPVKTVKQALQYLNPSPISSGGTVIIKSEPSDAKVWLGKSYQGKTPLTIKNAPPGRHILTFVKAEYEKTTKEIVVEKGKSVSCTVTMLTDSGILIVKSQPSGGKVYIDGAFLGTAPVEIKKIDPGKRKVVVDISGKKWEKEVDVEKGKTLELIAEILPKEEKTSSPKNEGPSPESAGDVVESFLPQGAQNGVFQVFVSHLEEVSRFRDSFSPRPGNKFVILYITQQNISGQLQVYPGVFNLIDDREVNHLPVENLSKFWPTALKAGGLRMGYLVFEIPESSRSLSIILTGGNVAPLTVYLNMQNTQ
jgi:hypothetical protein